MTKEIIYSVFTVRPFNEIVLALFIQLPFDSFEEKDDSFDAYLNSEFINDEIINAIESICNEHSVSYQRSVLENQNWNEKWESNFAPVEIGNFVRIRADFHEPLAGFDFELVIHPKMAFGTGHHQTTSMMIQAMSQIYFNKKSVLDYGCGTGILAILAAKSGAYRVIGVDYEYSSYENTRENIIKNNCQDIEVIHGILADVPKEEFDIVLANINRNVLLDTADDLNLYIKTGGILLISGILIDDYQIIFEKYSESLGYKLLDKYTTDNWLCLKFSK